MGTQRAGTQAPYLTLEKSDMKKTLVALAALAATGAFAQSTVTLYGKIDAGLEFKDVGGVSTTKLQSGNFSGSRWGMKGTEDLGGGLKANFQVESGFNVDAGSSGQGGLLFGRQAYVGVSGGFGSLTVGRQYTPGDNALGWDAMGATGAMAGPMYAVFTSNYANIDNKATGRQNNSISYSLPAMGGVGAQVMFAPNESDAAGQRYTGLNVSYAGGPLYAVAAWEQQTTTGAAASNSGWVAGGSYDLGAAKVSVGFAGGTSDASVKDTGWSVGVAAPVGAATLSAGYASETSKTAAGAESKTTAFGLNAVYMLSKRTNAYAGLINKTDTNAANVATKSNALVTGVRHDF